MARTQVNEDLLWIRPQAQARHHAEGRPLGLCVCWAACTVTWDTFHPLLVTCSKLTCGFDDTLLTPKAGSFICCRFVEF